MIARADSHELLLGALGFAAVIGMLAWARWSDHRADQRYEREQAARWVARQRHPSMRGRR